MNDVETRAGSAAPMPAPLVGLAVLGMGLVFAAMLLLPAGRLDWMLAWAYVALVLVFASVSWGCLARWNPELIERRMHYGEGTKTWDAVLLALLTPVMIAVYVVAGLEARDGVSSLPLAVWPLGLALFVLGAALLIGSMVVNPFFEKTVRIQAERGHRVIDTGPYARVRHPGYAGFLGWLLSAPLLLGSLWAFAPTALAVVGLVIRTVLEDRTLQAELPGYREYAARVRFRLVPGVW